MNNKVYKFYVNTYSGIDFWIEVTNGLITKFTNVINGEKTEQRLNELYLGKTINHFVEDYAQGHLKNIFCAVKSDDIVGVANKYYAVDTKISNVHKLIYNNKIGDKDDVKDKEYRQLLNTYQGELHTYEREFKEICEEVATNTGFKNKVKIK